MTRVLGVDGCPGGWCVVGLESGESSAGAPTVVTLFREILTLPADLICVDIPIGLLCGGRRRRCDELARALLGQRRSCVFDPPCRHALGHDNHQSASAANLRCTGRGISIQAFHISDKIADVDGAIATDLSARVLEVHPEVCFLGLNSGIPLLSNKKRLSGRAERWALLRGILPDLPAKAPKASQLLGRCEPDDYIDALVAAWTALSVAGGAALRVPDHPEMDGRGLRLEMWHPDPMAPSR